MKTDNHSISQQAENQHVCLSRCFHQVVGRFFSPERFGFSLTNTLTKALGRVPLKFSGRMMKIVVVSVLGCLFMTGCGKPKGEEETSAEPEVLIQVGDSVLTREMVNQLIPEGLSASDSIRMFDVIVEAWVDRNMLVNLAGSQLPDIEKVERMVEEYREQLLANEYRRVMADDKVSGVTDADVKEYYEKHSELFSLEKPLIKGIYLKIDRKAPQLREVEKWVRSAASDDIDNIENYGLQGALEYDYFGDTWVDWPTVADHIPYRFGEPDTFVSGTEFFETEEDGTIYMIRILDYIKSGNKMPIEYAESRIRERLLEQRRVDYDKRLLNSLFKKGLNAKTIKPGTYTPNKYR